MDVEQIRDYCLSLTDVTEDMPFGPDTLVFRINSKIFCLLALDVHPPSFNVKCNPEDAIAQREQYDAVQPGFHMNKKHWNTIVVDGSLPPKILQQFIADSYHLVAKPKKQVRGKN